MRVGSDERFLERTVRHTAAANGRMGGHPVLTGEPRELVTPGAWCRLAGA